MHLRKSFVAILGVAAFAALAGCGGSSTSRQPTPASRLSGTSTTTTTTTVAFVASPQACWGTTTVPGSLQLRLALYPNTLNPTNVAACETLARTVAPPG